MKWGGTFAVAWLLLAPGALYGRRLQYAEVDSARVARDA